MDLMCSHALGHGSVTGGHSCCLSKFMAMAVAWGARWRLMPTCPAGKPSEYQSRPLISITFGRFVKWPAGLAAGKATPSPFVCSAGSFFGRFSIHPCREALDGKPVVIRRIVRPQDAADCRSCSLVDRGKPFKRVPGALNQVGVLTVSDIPGFSGEAA